MFHSNSFLYPPIHNSLYKIEILLFSSFASFFTKIKILARQLAFMYFLLLQIYYGSLMRFSFQVINGFKSKNQFFY